MHLPSSRLRQAGTFTLPSGTEIALVEMTGVVVGGGVSVGV